MIIKGPNAWCNTECQTGHAMDNVKKLRDRKALEERKAEREKRAADKKRKNDFNANVYSYQFELTKKAAQVLANRLDADKPCICCDEPRGNAQFCGGHGKTAGAHPELALDLCNIAGQRNALCNQHKSGNWSGDKHSKGYKQGILDRYGQEMLDYLESHRDRPQLSCQELIELRAVYNAEIRRLDRGELPTRNWREPGDFDRLRAELPCNKVPA